MEMFEKYFNKETIKKAETKKILEIMKEYNGNEGIYVVEGSSLSNFHVVVVSDIVYCSCLGSYRGFCSHILKVIKYLLESKRIEEEKIIEILEKTKKSNMEVKK